ncbi:hypothetical protein [Nonomuraea rhodomycinica]|uniref:ABC-2 type transport system permease protein n=1 Tax=Nonomuraea rhodomycinica TaxID=1712872 RepID=A0A7Y6J106_9ACTN|nr:hypothetical protein [Nonomuraea rhodomycinica]NUW46719.1 hypothetical protein [Nonomuraea rhodomycinica]
MIALVAFRVAAYVRSHRVFQAFLPILVMISIVYASRAPRGAEVAALTDSAVLVIPFLAWATRGLLDTEPDEQRAISATAVGGRLREVAAGLLAALVTCMAFAALTLGCGLALGLSATPSRGVVAAGVVVHALAVLAGVALGALTSRPVMPSPAYSVMALVAGFLMMLLVGASPAYWLTVPVTAWMKAAGAGRLVSELPGLAAISLAWCLAALALYGYLRRDRP